jgi:hypothetical protein
MFFLLSNKESSSLHHTTVLSFVQLLAERALFIRKYQVCLSFAASVAAGRRSGLLTH